MKERPILFSGPMVSALLNGSKTQTRRMVKMKSHRQIEERDDGTLWPWMYDGERDSDAWMRCPYGQPGDRLWVRETFRGCRAYEVQGYKPKDWGNKPIWFEADGTPPGRPDQWALRSRPSIHMPRWASRITLEVTGVRVERLQDISDADAIAEGIVECPIPADDEGPRRIGYMVGPDDGTSGLSVTPIEPYRNLWESINGTGSWDANPWVWVVSFKRVEGGAA